jgi:integrase
VRIDAAVSKIHRRRIVHLFPNAKAWIKLAKEHYTSELGTLSYMGLRRLHKRICKHVGWKKFPQDVFRHTAASYMVGELKDPGRVANELGNSPRILLQHYRELVSDEDTRKFWAILPPKELIS